MKTLWVVAMIATTLEDGTPESVSAESRSKTGIKNVVLVHGAFTDGPEWEAAADILSMIAKRANAKTIDVNYSHLAHISDPKETIKLVEEATAHPANQ
jgi:hypothetical protein